MGITYSERISGADVDGRYSVTKELLHEPPVIFSYSSSALLAGTAFSATAFPLSATPQTDNGIAVAIRTTPIAIQAADIG